MSLSGDFNCHARIKRREQGITMKRFNCVKKFYTSLLMLFCLTSCDLLSGKEKDVKTLDTVFFNYTAYKYIYGISFMNVEKPFRYDQAAGASCCFLWNKKQTKPVTLRVVWAVVFDRAQHDAANYDPYTSKESPPGTRWCEAIIPIQQPYPANPEELILELFPNGEMKAHFSSVSDPPEASMPLSEEQYRDLPGLPEGQYCLKEIPNPMYGLERPKHYE